jgi:hypothetical protein
MSQRTQRKAALQASQQLAWDATHDDLPVDQTAPRQTPDAEGQRMRAGEGERRMTALEEWRARRVKRQLVDLEVRASLSRVLDISDSPYNSVQMRTTSHPQPFRFPRATNLWILHLRT